LLATLSARTASEGSDLRSLLRAEPALRGVDAGALDAAFDVDAAARRRRRPRRGAARSPRAFTTAAGSKR
jgi:hypothetical protein